MDEEKTEERKEENNSHEDKTDLTDSIREISKKADVTEKVRKNPWFLSTLVLGAIVLVLIAGSVLNGGITGNVVSENTAGDNLVAYLNTVADSEVTLISIEEDLDMYLVTVGFKGDEIPIYVTKDGAYYTMSLLPITDSTSTTPTSSDIPTSDNPLAELFIWSYCPYGVQGLGPFAEVAKLLGDTAEFKVVTYYDGHGDYETQQNKIQSCIQKLYKDKYWDYALGFVEDIYPVCSTERTEECDKTESIKLMNSLGIDSDAVMACVASQGEDLLAEASARAKEVGVTGSPSLVINDVKASPSSRTAEAFKDSICEGFNTAPSECETELDSTTATASGSC